MSPFTFPSLNLPNHIFCSLEMHVGPTPLYLCPLCSISVISFYPFLPSPCTPLYDFSTNTSARKVRSEVMWPGLIANKLLRKSFGSDRFAADIPNTEPLLEIPSSSKSFSVSNLSNNPKAAYKVRVGTWNVGGVAPPDDLKLEDWLDTRNNTCDVYILGFQEIVKLSAVNVLGRENCRISMKWNSLIGAALNKSMTTSKKIQEPKVGEKQKVYPVKDGNPREGVPKVFKCIISKQMVGIFVTVWVRGDLHQLVCHPSISCVGCGVMGCLGNKGAVSVRFFLHETSFCIVCSHLASGGKDGDEWQRNSDAMEILSRTTFPRGPSLDLPQKILDHDRIMWLGDLNYRISLSEAKTRGLVNEKNWDMLLDNDQLRVERTEGRVFEGWHEGVIEFAPTYKYHPNSDEYYGFAECDQRKKGEKKRAPAWCDRILWYGNGLKQNHYGRGESRLSDHRPVHAIFTVEVEVSRKMKALESFSMSDRFNSITDHLNIFSRD